MLTNFFFFFCVHRYDEPEVPLNTEDLKLWLNDTWKQKEKRLANFASTSSFSSNSQTTSDNNPFVDNALYLALMFWTLIQVLHVKIKVIICLIIIFICFLEYSHLWLYNIINVPLLVCIVVPCIFGILIC